MTRRCALLSVTVVALLLLAPVQRGGAQAPEAWTFRTLELWTDTGDVPLAAWQLDVSGPKGSVRVVGIEGGDHPAFADPPHYDPRAMQGERVIIAAFSTARALPAGRIRLATIHLQVAAGSEPAFDIAPSVLATVGGAPIDADVFSKQGSGS